MEKKLSRLHFTEIYNTGHPEGGHPEGGHPEGGHPEGGHPEGGHPEGKLMHFQYFGDIINPVFAQPHLKNNSSKLFILVQQSLLITIIDEKYINEIIYNI